MRFSCDKKIDSIVRKYVRAGWLFSRGKKHGQLRSPCGRAVLIVPGSPSCRRAWKNFQHDVQRIIAKTRLISIHK
jgi:hypothetical protein